MERKNNFRTIKMGKLRPKGFKLISQDNLITAATTKRDKVITN